MKYSKLLCLAASVLVLTACGKNTNNKGSNSSSSGSSDTTPVKDDYSNLLKTALDSLGTNYSVKWVLEEEKDDPSAYNPTTMYADGYIGHIYEQQITGFGKVALDDNTYHYFDHYRPDNITEWDGEYFDLRGRRDYDDQQLARDASVASFFDLSKFEKISETRYRATDEENIVGYLNSINTSMGYYFLGAAHEGIEIVLNDDGSFKQIDWYGIGDEDTHTQVSPDIWSSAIYYDIGTTKDDIFFNYVADVDNIPAPTLDDLVIISSTTKKNVYNGMTFNFENFVVGPKTAYRSVLYYESEFIGFVLSNPNELDGYEGELINFTATIDSAGGHTVLKDLKNIVEVDKNYCDEQGFPVSEIYDGEYYLSEYGDWQYGSCKSGTIVNVNNAIYMGYESNEYWLDVKLAYVFEGDYVPMTFRFQYAFEPSGSQVEAFWRLCIDTQLTVGLSLFSIANGTFMYIGEQDIIYVSTNSVDFQIHCNFEEVASDYINCSVPTYDGFLGYESFFIAEIPTDDTCEKYYKGVVGIADIKADRVAKFVEEYSSLLEDNEYDFVTSYEEYEDGPLVYVYAIDSALIAFTEPIDGGGYYYTQIQVCDSSIEYEYPVYED